MRFFDITLPLSFMTGLRVVRYRGESRIAGAQLRRRPGASCNTLPASLASGVASCHVVPKGRPAPLVIFEMAAEMKRTHLPSAINRPLDSSCPGIKSWLLPVILIGGEK